MRFQILLLLLAIKAENSLTWSSHFDIEFPPDILFYDLQAFSQYYKKFEERLPAYVHLPNEVTFKLQMKKDGYLKLYGYFRFGGRGCCVVPSYHYGLYFKNNQFFYKNRITFEYLQISPNAWLCYKPPLRLKFEEQAQAYLSITYSSLAEVEQDVKTFYLENKQYLDNVLAVQTNPSTFLTSYVPHPHGNILEYTIMTGDTTSSTAPMADGLLRVLLEVKEVGALSFTKNTEALRLVFNPETLKLTALPEIYHVHAGSIMRNPIDDGNVFGIRMARTGFLSRVSNGEWKMFSNRDLSGDPIPIQRSTYFYDLLQKVKSVEPRLSYFRSTLVKDSALLKRGRFQVHGEVLIKSVNLSGGYIDEDCPFTIMCERQKFWFDGHWEEKICTDESKLWLQTEDGPSFIETQPSA